MLYLANLSNRLEGLYRIVHDGEWRIERSLEARTISVPVPVLVIRCMSSMDPGQL